jgi:AcrR family transcriptional regulator
MSPSDMTGAARARANDIDGGGGRVLRARGQRTRARLVEAGSTVFARRGYHAARVDDVVEAARSSHGTFYLYFSSKEDLFDQIVAEVASELEILVDEMPVVTNTAKGRTDLRDWLDRFADFYERYGPVIRAWTEAELSGEPLGRHGEDVVGRLTAAMTRNIRLPKRSRLDPTIAALALMTMVERLNYYASTSQVQASRDELLDTLADTITSALFT